MAAEPTPDGCLIVFNDLNSAASTLIPLATPYGGSGAGITVTLGSADGHPDVGIGNEGDSGQYDFVAFLEGGRPDHPLPGCLVAQRGQIG